MTRFFLLFTLTLLMTASPVMTSVSNAQPSPIPAGQHGAAYQTTKDMFFGFRSATVTGLSSELSAGLSWTPEGDEFRIQAAVPVESFRSGVGKRDRHVAEILRAPDHPAVRFSTGWLPARAIREAIAQGAARVPGRLEVSGREVPVEFTLRRVAAEGGDALLAGQLSTTFEELGVTVPSVGGGLVASASEDLDLFVQIRLDRITGGGGLLD